MPRHQEIGGKPISLRFESFSGYLESDGSDEVIDHSKGQEESYCTAEHASPEYFELGHNSFTLLRCNDDITVTGIDRDGVRGLVFLRGQSTAGAHSNAAKRWVHLNVKEN